MDQNKTEEKEAIQNPIDYSEEDAEQPYIAHFAASRWGITAWNYSREEYASLREYALVLHLDEEVLTELDRDFSFIHDMARSMRTGAHNSMTGMCFDIAIRNYAKVASSIEDIICRYTAADIS